ncbi:hypothetical protein [Rhizobium rhizogenes]|uniref:Uncharacterized protein n=1 Tax=Rhizobium rhizogenes TaxID=359 RepID=A0AA92H722_RHIRH|nr:hypothetical protein [Rhizobium rhizogenes]PVE49931.1 hypothetical protein DC430_23330 [Rhizobium rhizogenes]PVE62644.1 hypothetical protein DC415_22080 [Agrobacterium tumefaciens]PVE70782.1 hypothetical protein DCP16_22080 [Sphingomonas sp. TPD3009]
MGAEAAASKYFNDPDGTFLILPHLRGSDHVNFQSELHRPFSIGDVDPAGPFIHVFNTIALGVVMRELDTITDFTRYLAARASLIRSSTLLASPSEAELVANYLQTIRKDGSHDFPNSTDFKGASGNEKLSFVQGEYAYLVRSPEYQRRLAANRPSYLWDRLIKLFTAGTLNGTQHQLFDEVPTVDSSERALRIMARATRLQRRHFAQALSGAIETCEEQKAARYARVLISFDPSTNDKMAYVFLVMRETDTMSVAEFRRMRASILQAYCLSALNDDKELKLCVGIAVNAQSDRGASEELIALEQQDWTPEFLEILQTAKHQFDISLNATMLSTRMVHQMEFPADPKFSAMSRQQRRALERQLVKQRS